MNHLALAKKIEAANMDAARGWGQLLGSRFIENDIFTAYVSKFKLTSLNSVFRFNSKQIAKDIPLVLDLFRQNDLPFLWYVGTLTEDSSTVREALLAQGLQSAGKSICLVLNDKKFKSLESLPGYEIQQVKIKQQISDWLKPFQISFNFPDDAVQLPAAYITKCLDQSLAETFFVGYLDGKPINCGSYFVSNGVSIIYNGGTLPEYRRQGYGKRMVEARVNHIRENYPTCIISVYTESDGGFAECKSAGFQEVYDYEKYGRGSHIDAS